MSWKISEEYLSFFQYIERLQDVDIRRLFFALFHKTVNEEEDLISLTQNTEVFAYTRKFLKIYGFCCFHYLEQKR